MTDEHLSADTLADLQEGLLAADGEAAARRHLESCGACRDDLAVLSDLPALLAAAGEVGPLPELAAHRLDRALADAVAEPAPPRASAAASTVTPLSADHRPPRGMKLLQVAAATVLVLGIGALGFSALRSIDTGSSGGAGTSSAKDAAGGAAERATAPITASGRDWTSASLRAAVPQLADGTLGPAVATYSTQRDSAGGGSSGGGSTPAPAVPSASAKALADAPAAALAAPDRLAACVTNLTSDAVQPLAVDLATFDGKPAGVFVFPATGDPSRLDVYVVAPDCPPGGLLYYASVPRS